MNACEELGTKIMAGRQALALSRAEFGARLGEVNRGTVAAWESGKRVPDREHLDKIGTLLGWTERERGTNALLSQRAAVLKPHTKAA